MHRGTKIINNTARACLSKKGNAMTESNTRIFRLADVKNPEVTLLPEISGDYRAHLLGFAAGLNKAMHLDLEMNITLQAAEIYARMCRRCLDSYEVRTLIRILPEAAQVVAHEVIRDAYLRSEAKIGQEQAA